PAEQPEPPRAEEPAASPVSIPRPAPEPPAPTPISARIPDTARRRPVVFEEQEEELDVPDFLK
ncbi:cell division protein FtsZ, partial [Streptosporangium sandarakinum]